MNNKKVIIAKTIQNYLNEINIMNDRQNRLIQSRKIFDYIAANIEYIKKSNIAYGKFFQTIISKLDEYEKDLKHDSQDIFDVKFYKKIIYPEKYRNLTKLQLRNFQLTRNKYYQEISEVKEYFDNFYKENKYYGNNKVKVFI